MSKRDEICAVLQLNFNEEQLWAFTAAADKLGFNGDVTAYIHHAIREYTVQRINALLDQELTQN